jgi:hypothetical protein
VVVPLPGLTLYGAANSQGSINFADSTSGTDSYDGGIVYAFGSGSPSMTFHVNGGAEAMRITSSGNVGIGTSSPLMGLHFAKSIGNIVYGGLDGNTNEFLLRGNVYYDTANARSQPIVTGYQTQISLQNNDGSIRLLTSPSSVAAGSAATITERMRINSSGNVGIGTSSPTSKLQINGDGTTVRLDGTANTSRNILIRNVGGSAEGTLQTDGNMHLLQEDASKYMRFSTANTERMRIDSAGSVYIGSTSDSGTGYHRISADGFVRHKRAGEVVAVFDRGTSDGDIVLFRKDSATVGSIGTEGGDLTIGTGDTGLQFGDGGEYIRPWNTTTNTSRDAALDLGVSTTRFKDLYLSGTASVSKTRLTTNNTTYWDLRRDSSTGHFVVSDDGLGDVFTILQSNGNVGIGTSSPSASAKLDVNGNVIFRIASATTSRTLGFTTSNGVDGWTIGNGVTASANQFVIYSNTAGAARLLINSSGNVGIGTTSPVKKLDVAGTSRITGEATFGNDILLTNDAYVYSSSGGSGVRAGWFLDGTNQAVRGYTAGTERMRIDSSGNVLFGVTSLTNNGSYFKSSASDLMQLNIGSTTTTTQNVVVFRNPNAAVGTISTNASATAYNTSSDQRLKENIADAEDAGSKVDAIQVRQFDWKADGSHQDYGMIAQELAVVAPEAVTQPENPEEMMGVDYSKLVPMLIKEIQSLRNRVATLEGN